MWYSFYIQVDPYINTNSKLPLTYNSKQHIKYWNSENLKENLVKKNKKSKILLKTLNLK